MEKIKFNQYSVPFLLFILGVYSIFTAGCMFSALTFAELFFCDIIQSSKWNKRCTDGPFDNQKIIKEAKVPNFKSNSWNFIWNTFAWTAAEDDGWNVLVVLLCPLYKQYTKDRNTSISSKGTKRVDVCILRLQSIYILYIQTNLHEKVKGWHSQVLSTVMPIFYGQRCKFGQRISLCTSTN